TDVIFEGNSVICSNFSVVGFNVKMINEDISLNTQTTNMGDCVMNNTHFINSSLVNLNPTKTLVGSVIYNIKGSGSTIKDVRIRPYSTSSNPELNQGVFFEGITFDNCSFSL